MRNKFNINKFCQDNSLTTAEPGDRHFREGWVNMHCPFCKHPERYHLGFNQDAGYWNCWSCGSHSDGEVVHTLLDISWREARQIIKRYGGRPLARRMEEEVGRPTSISLPRGTGPLNSAARKYLVGRGFDPDKLEDQWGLLATGYRGQYKFRIIAPIFIDEKLVSYQGRDYTGRNKLPYKACPSIEEVVPHKNTLYASDVCRGHTVVVVEGITDVWRLGPGAVATFGTQWSMPQAAILRRFPRRLIMFDAGEKEAQESAHRLGKLLAGFSGTTEIIDLGGGDPAGSLTDEQAAKVMRELGV